MEKDLSRCIGLWLAEGDSKTSREVTFTNNRFELIKLFYSVLNGYSDDCNVNLQVYKPSKSSEFEKLDENVNIREYTDDRASKPYYILRFYSTELCKKWNKEVEKSKQNEDMYQYILQGFFAGEGSVYEGARKNRKLRISQGKPDDFLEDMLDYFELNYYFRAEGRSYVITKKRNWDIFADLDLCELHPRKKDKFWSIYEGFQEEHYQKGHLKEEVYNALNSPWRTKELAEKFDRSQARLCDVLMLLKEEGEAINYKVESYTYWIRTDRNAVIISEVKAEYLELLRDKPLKVGKIADHFSVRKNSAYKNLRSLKELELIKKQNHEWETIENDQKVIVL